MYDQSLGDDPVTITMYVSVQLRTKRHHDTDCECDQGRQRYKWGAITMIWSVEMVVSSLNGDGQMRRISRSI